MKFDPRILTDADRELALRLLAPSAYAATYGTKLDAPWRLANPDLVIAPCGEPYLYRWRLTPYAGSATDRHGNCYLHVQVLSDPERPLHDHPWDNTSLILAGGYDEIYDPTGGSRVPLKRKLREGDFVYRTAETSHRLILPPDVPYAMTQFTTGRVRKEWGFWTPEGWRASLNTTVRAMAEGTNVSVWTEHAAALEPTPAE